MHFRTLQSTNSYSETPPTWGEAASDQYSVGHISNQTDDASHYLPISFLMGIELWFTRALHSRRVQDQNQRNVLVSLIARLTQIKTIIDLFYVQRNTEQPLFV